MIYVVDSCVFRHIFIHVYRTVIPEIWDSLEHMLSTGEVISVREVYRELELQFSNEGSVLQWLKKHRRSFLKATDEEAKLVREIYSFRNFQNGVSEKNILAGRPVADAFLVARAKSLGGTIVTREVWKPNAASIPNICDELDVKYIGEEEFQLLLRNRQGNFDSSAL